jgi:hypothetical protein
MGRREYACLCYFFFFFGFPYAFVYCSEVHYSLDGLVETLRLPLSFFFRLFD